MSASAGQRLLPPIDPSVKSTPVLRSTGAATKTGRRTGRKFTGKRFAAACWRALERPWTKDSETELEAELKALKLTHFDRVAWGQVIGASNGDNRCARWLTERIGESAPEPEQGRSLRIIVIGANQIPGRRPPPQEIQARLVQTDVDDEGDG